MSNNPEKIKVVDSDGEKDESDTALSVITTGESSVFVREEEEAVVIAGELARAEEMVAKGKNDESEEKESRPKKLKTDEEMMGSGKGEIKNPKKNSAGLTHLPPKGSPVCNVCGRWFISRKALFGHMNAHRHTPFQGVLPPEFTAAVKRCSIPGQNSSFIRVTEEGGSSSVAGKEKEETREQAVVAAQLVIGAIEEAFVKEKIDHGGSGVEIKGTPRNLKRTDEATDSLGKGKVKRQKQKATVLSQLPPEGSSVCKVCGKWFKSQNALSGHMNAHRHTPFQGSLPPEFIEIVRKGRQNASLVRVTTGGESSNSAANERASASGGKGLSIDLNVKPVEEEEVKEDTESASVVKFDLNKSPPNDKENEENSK